MNKNSCELQDADIDPKEIDIEEKYDRILKKIFEQFNEENVQLSEAWTLLVNLIVTVAHRSELDPIELEKVLQLANTSYKGIYLSNKLSGKNV